MSEHVFPHQPLAAQAEHEVIGPFIRERLLHATSTSLRAQVRNVLLPLPHTAPILPPLLPPLPHSRTQHACAHT